mmetsp:Transcript_12184/g.18697  ORF Transcript_12184/g.18697 Transcript_12184/m.18697 type:complete len:317 (-) Transcript_12184:1073-2023(-)
MFFRNWQVQFAKGIYNSTRRRFNIQQQERSSSSLMHWRTFPKTLPADTTGAISAIMPLGGLFLLSTTMYDDTNVVLLEEGKKAKHSNIHVEKELLQNRKIFLIGSIDDRMAKSVVMDLMWLAHEKSDEPITIYIHSSGGLVSAGLAIHDMMSSMPCTVRTVCLGKAYSMAAILLASGTKGHRHCLPNSRVMIHQPSSSISRSSASDVAIHAEQVLSTHNKLVEIISSHTGQSFAIVNEAIDRDNYMSPEDAKKFGVVDEIGLMDFTPNDNVSSSEGSNNNKNKTVEEPKNPTTSPTEVEKKNNDAETKNKEEKSST